MIVIIMCVFVYKSCKLISISNEMCKQISMWFDMDNKEYCIVLFFSLHLHEIVEGLHFHCRLSVCVSVCVSVCLALLVNKIPAEWIR